MRGSVDGSGKVLSIYSGAQVGYAIYPGIWQRQVLSLVFSQNQSLKPGDMWHTCAGESQDLGESQTQPGTESQVAEVLNQPLGLKKAVKAPKKGSSGKRLKSSTASRKHLKKGLKKDGKRKSSIKRRTSTKGNMRSRTFTGRKTTRPDTQVPFLFSFVHLTTRDQDDFVASDVWVPKP